MRIKAFSLMVVLCVGATSFAAASPVDNTKASSGTWFKVRHPRQAKLASELAKAEQLVAGFEHHASSFNVSMKAADHDRRGYDRRQAYFTSLEWLDAAVPALEHAKAYGDEHGIDGSRASALSQRLDRATKSLLSHGFRPFVFENAHGHGSLLHTVADNVRRLDVLVQSSK